MECTLTKSLDLKPPAMNTYKKWGRGACLLLPIGWSVGLPISGLLIFFIPVYLHGSVFRVGDATVRRLPGKVRLLIRRLHAVARTCNDGLRAFCFGLGAYRFFPCNACGRATGRGDGAACSAAARTGADERGQEQHGVGGF